MRGTPTFHGEQAFHKAEKLFFVEGSRLVQVRAERFARDGTGLPGIRCTELSMVNLTTNAIQCLVGHLVAGVPEEIKVCHPRRVGRFNAKTNAISIEAQTHSEHLNIVGVRWSFSSYRARSESHTFETPNGRCGVSKRLFLKTYTNGGKETEPNTRNPG